MERQELVNKMTVFIKKALANKAAEINPDVPMRDQGLSSSGRLEFFTMCEDEWSCSLTRMSRTRSKPSIRPLIWS